MHNNKEEEGKHRSTTTNLGILVFINDDHNNNKHDGN